MAGGFMDKMKDFVKGNPEQAASAIDKVEEMVDQRTGGKYTEHIDKGSDTLREQLGLPPEATQPVPGEPIPGGPSPCPSPARRPCRSRGRRRCPNPVPSPCPSRDRRRCPSPVPRRSPSRDRCPTRQTQAAPTRRGCWRAGADSVPNPEPMRNDPQQPGSIDEPLTPGGPQRPGQPGGPLDEGLRPEGEAPPPRARPSRCRRAARPSRERNTPTQSLPGGAQPDTGGPDVPTR